MFEFDSYRTNPGVDPTVSVWNWEIPLYLFLGGLVAGIMIIGALQSMRKSGGWDRRLSVWGSAAAAILLSVGMGALFLDLAHKAYVPRFYMAFKPTSPMSWGSWILLLAYPALALWFLESLTDSQWQALRKRVAPLRWLDGIRTFAQTHRKPLLSGTVAVGIALGTYTGILLSALVARPLWNSGLLGPLFLASGVSAAAAFFMLLRTDTKVTHTLLRWDVAALLVEAAILSLFLIEKVSGSAMDSLSARLLLAGPYTGAFFGLVVLCGIVTPLALEVWELRHGSKPGIVAPVLVLIGSLSLRAILVSAGQFSNYSMLIGG
jgi:protein NrfD